MLIIDFAHHAFDSFLYEIILLYEKEEEDALEEDVSTGILGKLIFF